MVSRHLGKGEIAAGLAAAVVSLLAGVCLAEENWSFDVIWHRNGHSFPGLIVEERADSILFKHVLRRPGTRTLVVDLTFQRDEIRDITRLDPAARSELAARVAALDRGGEREKQRLRELALEEIRWPDGAGARRYASRYFVLEADTREEWTRLATVRLEDLFAAFAEGIGTLRTPQRPTLILIYGSLERYRERLRETGLNLLNPACFDSRSNTILAYSDLEQRLAEYEAIKTRHEGLLRDLEAQEKKLRKHFQGAPPRPMLAQLWQARRSIQLLNAENESLLERLRRPFFAVLHHEAFHAYVENHLFPAAEGGLPPWLNEGLAQVYENALVEGGELRVGSIEVARLQAVQEAVKKKQLVPLAELLTAEPRRFQVVHRTEAQATDRLYLTAWGLAHYLLLRRKAINLPRLQAYVAELNRGTAALEAFRLLADQPLEQVETDLHRYLAALKADGTLRTSAAGDP
jgi:hypothetical protein